MLDSFEILTTSGVVLWSRSYVPVQAGIINSLINEVFIEEKGPATTIATNDASATKTPPFKREKYTLKWTTAKDLGLIFVAVYQSLLHLTWIDKLLDNVRTIFTDLYKSRLSSPDTIITPFPFDQYFDQQVRELEPERDVEQSEKELGEIDIPLPVDKREDNGPPPIPGIVKTGIAAVSTDASPIITPDSSRPGTPNTVGHLLTAKSTGRKSRRARKAANSPTTNASSGEENRIPKSKTAKSGGKKMRKWNAEGYAEEDDGNITLDYSAELGSGDDIPQQANVEGISAESWGQRTRKGEFVVKEIDDKVHDILSSASAKDGSSSSSGIVGSGLGTINNLFRGLVGGKTITQTDLDKTMKGIEDLLLRKNVAPEAAKKLCTAVSQQLLGMKTSSFETISTAVNSAMESSLQKLLTPSTSLDLLHEIQSSRKSSRPYVMSIVGVNGVGKSTSLSKLAFFLLQNHYRVLIAACDTFRSGAVEQLGVHARNLSELCLREGLGANAVALYQKGYGKDAAHIARDAVSYGVENKFDVVLIDTAGRRHNDARLMSSLAKFGQLANPDKIFMVGEALVGTDSVAQARNFNTAFGAGRGLDGFIISKCDTVGEMIGTLVSMVFATGIPVVFLGVGQHYSDLRTLNVRWAVRLLMS
ncbi:MAG: hypothetical protein M1834_003469 [Cirrosporium novae-zelandiae]|nr:MAG: hypothetical protein M1834_003469 [Cirrosporium novae-zelandiae]